MPVVPIPCLADNYAYGVFLEGNAQALVVDPSEAGPVIEWLEQQGLRLGGLLLTHHHWDHVGGVDALEKRYRPLPVVAHAIDAKKVRGVTMLVEDGQRFELGGLEIEVMHVPGHTLGAVAYRFCDSIFTGDTLFAAGCGRLFEGTATQMFDSLSRLAALRPNTQMYCGHEYAMNNLAFARVIEPGNLDVLSRIERVQQLRHAGQPSVPSTIAEELATNPFLRCDIEEFRMRAPFEPELHGAELFAMVRARRNGFQV